MVEKIFLCVILLCLLLLSCNHDNKIIKYYESGEILSEIRINDDSIKQGETITYYKNGVIKSIVTYFDGKKNGEVYSYYENGKLESVFNWLNDTPYGNGLIFNAKGQMDEYRYYNRRGDLIYKIKFDENGKKKEEYGVVITPILVGNQCFKLDKIYEVELDIAYPPNTESVLINFGEVDDKTLEFINSPKYIQLFNNSEKSTINLTPSKPGEYRWKLEYIRNGEQIKHLYYLNDFPDCNSSATSTIIMEKFPHLSVARLL